MNLFDFLRQWSLRRRYTEQPLRAFAADISRHDPLVTTGIRAPLARSETIVVDDRPARRPLEPIDALADAVIEALVVTGWVLHFDWRETALHILPAIDRLLAKLGAGTLDPTELEAIHEFIESHAQGRILRTEIDLVYGPLCEALAWRELRILNINRGGDDYAFVLVTSELYHRWVDTQLARDFIVEDPGWQFNATLKGTPYARFMHRRRLRSPQGDQA